MRPSLIQIPFLTGQDESVDERSQAPGVLTRLENARQIKAGVVSRRNGFTVDNFVPTKFAVTSEPATIAHTDAPLVGIRRLVSAGSELIALTKDRLLSWSESQRRWLDRDKLSEAIIRREVVANGSGSILDFDFLIANGLEVYSWRSGSLSASGRVFVSVRDVTSGAYLFSNFEPNSSVTNATAPRIAVAGTTLILAYQDATTNTVTGMQLNLLNPRAWAPCSFSQSSSGPIAMCSMGNQVAIITQLASGTNRAVLNVISSIGAVTSVVTIAAATSAIVGLPVVAFDGTNLCLVVSTATVLAFSMVVFATSGAIVVPLRSLGTNAVAPTIWSGQVVADGVGGWYIFGRVGVVVSTYKPGVHAWRWSAGSVETYFGASIGSEIGSAPFVQNGKVYAALAVDLYTGTASFSSVGTGVVANFAAGVPAARPVSVFAVRIYTGNGLGVPATARISANTLVFPCATIADASGRGQMNLSRAQIDFADAFITEGADHPVSMHESAQWGDLTVLSGGLPSFYDGMRVAELSFLRSNSLPISSSVVRVSGGIMLDGTYTYRTYYEHVDATGIVHRSPLSAPIVIVLDLGFNQVEIRTPSLAMTRRQSECYPTPAIRLIVLRSARNGTAELLYRQTLVNVPVANLNDPSSETFVVIDNQQDDLSAPLAYSTGGLIEGFCTPSLHCLIKHRRRIAAVGDDLRTVWLSSEYEEREAPRFNELTTISLDERITALGSMDDKLVMFTADSIYLVYGDGPSPTGVQSDWTSPQRIPSDVGCIEPRSVVSIPDGLIFRAAQGLYLLSRSLQVVPFSNQVQDTLGFYPTITSAKVVEEDSLVIFECRDATSPLDGVALVYNFQFRFWSVDKRPFSGGTSVATSGAAVWRVPGRQRAHYYVATPNAQVYRDNPISEYDNGNYFTMVAETAWISAQGPHAFQRVRKVSSLGRCQGTHSLQIALAYDFATNYAQQYTWTSPPSQSTRFEIRCGSQNGANPRCAAIRVRLINSSGTIHPEWSGIALEVVAKPDMARRGRTNRT
jgi:hypothetical protein